MSAISDTLSTSPDRDDAELSSVRLSEFGLRREPPRPVDDRGPNYEAVFDFDTLFYDVFRGVDDDSVICLGPPLLNCEAAIGGAEFRVAGSRSPLATEYFRPRSNLQPTCRFRLSGPGLKSSRSVVMRLSGKDLEIPIRPSGQERFAGRRVITTLSKNNPLDWIGDWATFNARIHGADALIVYDNASTAYDPTAIREHLAGVDGLAAVLVVPWPFPYGQTPGPRNIQDSFYCQPGALEHVRRRYCPHARSVLNTDVDELVITPPGETIFERAERSGRAAVFFHGLWVEKVGPGHPLPIRHTDCLFLRRSQVLRRQLRRLRRLLRPKWVAVPHRCNDDMGWGVHNVYALDPKTANRAASWRIVARDVFYRHFRQLGNLEARRKWAVRYSLRRHAVDRELAAAFTVAFPNRRVRTAAFNHLVRRRPRRTRS